MLQAGPNEVLIVNVMCGYWVSILAHNGTQGMDMQWKHRCCPKVRNALMIVPLVPFGGSMSSVAVAGCP